MRAVRFDRYGDLDVLEVREVDDPVAAPGQVLVRVRAAAINPAENFIRSGAAAAMWSTAFPSGQGTDLAGEVVALGAGVTGFESGAPVLGWTDERVSHAELVAVPADHLVAKPESLSWEVAGSMFTAPMAAFASVQTVKAESGDVVAVSGAAGGVGSVAVQLLRHAGATVIALAGPRNHDWLASLGAIPVQYGEGQADRVRKAAGGRLDAFVDTFGGGYVDLAIELGVQPRRVNTLADLGAARKHGVGFNGSAEIADTAQLSALVRLVADGAVTIPIAGSYPLDEVRDAYAELNARHTRGKIVLLP
ncbi:NADP-dependent oxidoreductase [Amycolatopsis ultiminotia]|uniref:NADP-dependent oxidoreductase n=1 Tax=Amycolatopsis ultiminotia TaxID=543629 RepID=A0ABP6V4Z7_9PSEU